MLRHSAVQLSHNHKPNKNMTTHTPGPWKKSNISPHIYGPQNEYLAICENPANAHLVASAPELLAALQAVAIGLSPASLELQKDSLADLCRTCSEIIQEAIAKAEGNA
jgi:hypothetical protein